MEPYFPCWSEHLCHIFPVRLQQNKALIIPLTFHNDDWDITVMIVCSTGSINNACAHDSCSCSWEKSHWCPDEWWKCSFFLPFVSLTDLMSSGAGTSIDMQMHVHRMFSARIYGHLWKSKWGSYVCSGARCTCNFRIISYGMKASPSPVHALCLPLTFIVA